MAELSGFWTTGGTKGDQQVSYTQAQWSTATKIMGLCSGFEGVATNYLNTLNGTVTGANTVAIDTGGGLVDGKWFLNDASQNVNIPSSAGGTTRIDRIVLRADWANFNVSVYRIAGTDHASPSVPAITQTSGTTYDVKLYQALVNSSGTVTLTDERTLASNNLMYRQGGSATSWVTNGTGSYVPPSVRMQCGTIRVSLGGGDRFATTVVTYPVAFSQIPIVNCTILYATGAISGDVLVPEVQTPLDHGFTAAVRRTGTGVAVDIDLYWIAIGPP